MNRCFKVRMGNGENSLAWGGRLHRWRWGKRVHELKVKIFRKVERIRGAYKELFLCYAGKFNYFFCLTGRMFVRFSRWFSIFFRVIPEGKYLYSQATVVSTEEKELCEEELLWGHVGLTQKKHSSSSRLCHWGCWNSQQPCDPRGSAGTLKEKPKASSCASHATTSTWFLAPHLALFSYTSSESDFQWHAAKPVCLPRLTAVLWLLHDIVLVRFHWLIGYFLVRLKKWVSSSFCLLFFSFGHSGFLSEQEHFKFQTKILYPHFFRLLN